MVAHLYVVVDTQSYLWNMSFVAMVVLGEKNKRCGHIWVHRFKKKRQHYGRIVSRAVHCLRIGLGVRLCRFGVPDHICVRSCRSVLLSHSRLWGCRIMWSWLAPYMRTREGLRAHSSLRQLVRRVCAWLLGVCVSRSYFCIECGTQTPTWVKIGQRSRSIVMDEWAMVSFCAILIGRRKLVKVFT